ncbi:hypothetical protein C8R45DRAFT_1047647 [Mycena sanguinolenta]|nr:hypothetical protein C8R45DRAFT_1047647 [Mycena sanguinolenta]
MRSISSFDRRPLLLVMMMRFNLPVVLSEAEALRITVGLELAEEVVLRMAGLDSSTVDDVGLRPWPLARARLGLKEIVLAYT